ncbi:energy-coupling factor transporter ATPase [Microbacterium album]|uniref:ABC transporter domain-containing protein n=1 Tax=Microbacterium album TaxID=2053191 RepID=A0A917MNL7_9MICO|nr:energy-coupling factor transporter ATPase [Microbacterium album]GGH42031.1 hypothetical protein GCM10010921_14980 [Microbacterium album]
MPPVDAPALLRLDAVSLTHPDAVRPTPRDVSLEVHPGEVVLLLGPSGSGKSTLALALDGLIPHALPAKLDGTISVDGIDTADSTVPELSTRVAMVFQDPDAQLVTGTVLDEVAFALENLRLPVDEVLSRTEAALRRMGLWDRRSWNPDRLSGGGRQRLAIACALAMGSPLLVLDEPTANLDPVGIEDVYEALADVVAQGDRAIVLVEHNLDAAVSLATRAVVLDAVGGVVFDGPAAELLRTHAETLAAMGVWLPAATIAALRLRGEGHRLDPLPLTPAQLRDALAADPDADRATSLLLSPAEAPAAPPSGAPPLVRVRGLTVTRQGAPVLRGVDLDIPAGSFTAVVGPNGAGKTTLVQAIAGVAPPPRGKVLVAGTDPGGAAARDLAARIGFVFQNPEHQFVAHTVFDELAHGLRLRGVPEPEVRARVTDMMDRFGLADRADAHPFLLSGGQKRRLSVGTALIAEPDVLALDEPTFGQDRARAAELLGLLRQLHAVGTTVVIVTHDLQLVADYATHVVVVADGRIAATGATAEIFADGRVLERAGLLLPPVHRALRAPVPARALGGAGAPAGPGPSGPGAPAAAGREAGTAIPETRPDPYAERPTAPAWRFLHHLNPLASIAAVAPAMLLLVFTRDLATPLTMLLIAAAILVIGARLPRRLALGLLVGVPLGIAAVGTGFSLWVDPAQVADTAALLHVGGWTLHVGAFAIGMATALRLAAIVLLAVLSGAATNGPELVRAAVQHLRVPYRIGYAALAAFRFVPRFGHELDVIRSAHRVRGHRSGSGPLARLSRGWGYIVPLLASAIRHAERVALAMDARAFGAHPTRTERHLVPLRARDLVFVLLFWAVTVLVFARLP